VNKLPRVCSTAIGVRRHAGNPREDPHAKRVATPPAGPRRHSGRHAEQSTCIPEGTSTGHGGKATVLQQLT
jgi:hypothetical protein